MKVLLLAKTEITPECIDLLSVDSTSADHLAEVSGRECYQTWARANKATAANEDYLANILKQQHFSVLEHASATFRITGVSRALTHELVRHRHLSFSQLSQRYVDQTEMGYVVPPIILDNTEHYLHTYIHGVNQYAQLIYETIFKDLKARGCSVKAARGAARAVLIEATTTSIVVTGNHRAWREFLQKRLSPAADIEIRELAQELLKQLRAIAPNTYQDFPEQ